MSGEGGHGTWVLLTCTLPRAPSGSRLALWRRLHRPGVAQVAGTGPS
ncbi:hypothetical protein KVF89_00380 [Nocardioides carbamazepini]|nr:hypothetical protein [Nocardioides carbamazepini]MCR1780975.1 hypothetical protein [Nocardioides carbamazepini]